MIIIPRGFAQRYAHLPWVTLTLVAINILIFAMDPHYATRIESELRQLVPQQMSLPEEQQHLSDFCQRKGIPEQRCHEIALALPQATSLESGAHGTVNDQLATEFLQTEMRRLLDKPNEKQQLALAKIYGTSHAFSKTSFTFRNLLEAGFRHEGVMHLAGNMFVLFTIGAWVEQRMNPVVYLLSYLIGSLLGLALHGAGHSFVLGASAGVATTLGLCLLFFYPLNMRFILSAPPLLWRREFYAPVWGYLIFSFFLSDLGGLVQSEVGSVAVDSHLVGWSVGVLFAFLTKKLDPQSWYCIYRGEHEKTRALFTQFKGDPQNRSCVLEAERLLLYNQENIRLKELVLWESFSAEKVLPGEVLTDMTARAAETLAVARRAHELPRHLGWLEQCWQRGHFEAVLSRLGTRTLEALSLEFAAKKPSDFRNGFFSFMQQRNPNSKIFKNLKEPDQHVA